MKAKRRLWFVVGSGVVVVALGTTGVVWWPSNEGDSDASPSSSDGPDDESGEYKVSESLCERMDWSVFDSLYEYSSNSWQFDLVEDESFSSGLPSGEGGFVGCRTEFPIEGVAEDESPGFHLGVKTYAGPEEAVGEFERGQPSGSSPDEEYIEKDLSPIDGCDDQRVDVLYDEEGVTEVFMAVTCVTENVTVSADIGGHPGAQEDLSELDPVAEDVMVPVITDALQLAAND